MTLVDCAAYNAWHGGTVAVGGSELQKVCAVDDSSSTVADTFPAAHFFDLLALLRQVPAFATYSKKRKKRSDNSLGNGIQWDTCQPALLIAATVSFIQSCTFAMSIFGKAVV